MRIEMCIRDRLNLTTSGLIIFGGLGFLVILDVLRSRSFKKLCLHSKIVIVMSIFLIAAGMLSLKATENITWLGAFFQSVSLSLIHIYMTMNI